MAWHALCERFGEARASFIVTSLDPNEGGGRAQPTGTDSAAPLPQPEVAPPGWLEPVRARALPDRFAIAGYRGERRVLLHWTRPVAPELRLTPALGIPGDELAETADDLDFDAYWGPDSAAELYHFIGKDIAYFHTLTRYCLILVTVGSRKYE